MVKEARVQSLIGELRSHMRYGAKEKRKATMYSTSTY